MELLLNINQYEYTDFLTSNVDTLILALKDFSSGYQLSYSLSELKDIVKNIHNSKKKAYISLNIIANENQILSLELLMPEIAKLDADGFVIADFGVLQLFKEANLTSKVILNPVTTITNKYSSKIANDLGIDHVCLANELNLKDILDISKYTKGNIEILAQGYYQICNSKRPLLSNFFKQFKIKSNSQSYFIKEESRDYSYPIIELNNEILVYIDRQRCIVPYLNQIIDSKVKYLRIDTVFMTIEEIKLIIDIYNNVINNLDSLDYYLMQIEKNTNSNLKCLDNISILKKEKNNE